MFLLPAISIILFKIDYISYWTMHIIDPSYDYSYLLVHKSITSVNLETEPYYWSLIYSGVYIFIWYFLCFSRFFWKIDSDD